jgi:SAM-dependent methyltransferase
MGRFVVDPAIKQQSDCGDPARDRASRLGDVGIGEDATMNAQQLLQEISDYCRQTGLAESTFGRRAVNDGKLASRLRNGGRITTDTLDRIRAFMAENRADFSARPALIPRAHESRPATPMPGMMSGTMQSTMSAPIAASAERIALPEPDPQRNFRFFDNRQKYLLFVNTCSEKWVVAHRVSLELANIHPRPPAVRVFDAGVGDGSVLTRVMRAMHDRFPTMPFYVVGKEISLEDIRLTLQKMADRFVEHPATALVLTNLAYADAPWLAVKSVSAASSLVWHEVPLSGDTAHRFESQIIDLEPFLAENWKAGVSPKTGNPVYERPVVMVIYREDHKFLLDPILPRPGGTQAAYDLVIASQPYRARASLDFKARRVVAPLARALGPGGRLIAIHSHGNDPGQEIIQQVWPGDNPFIHDRHQIMRAVKHELGPAGRELNFNVYADNRSLFRYDMHTLPSEVSESIGTSTLFAAWNAAIYVAQVEDDRLESVVGAQRYLDATREVLRRHGGLWFFDESYVISRRRE